METDAKTPNYYDMETRIINASLTEVYSGGGKWLTQNFPTCYREWHKRVLLVNGQGADLWREADDAEKAAWEANPPKPTDPDDPATRLFIDMWNEACMHYPVEMHAQSLGGFDKDTGLFYISKVKLTEAEARTTLAAGRPQGLDVNSYLKNNNDIRVNLPSREMNHSVDYPFYYCRKLEVANAHSMTFKRPVYGCPALHTINGLVDVGFSSSLLFCDQPTLRSLTITRLSKSLNLGNQPLLTADSFRRIIAGAVDEPTITVHPEVYARLIDPGNAEWNALVGQAAEKQITFTIPTQR